MGLSPADETLRQAHREAANCGREFQAAREQLAAQSQGQPIVNHWRRQAQGQPNTRMVPQVAARIPATNSHTLPLRTNAAQARAASAASARRSISLK